MNALINANMETMSVRQQQHYERLVGRLRGLLEHWVDSGIELFLELRKVELSNDWKAPGHATFKDFLAVEFPNALGFERYNNVIQAIEVHGVKFVKTIGVHSCHATVVTAIAESPERSALLRESVMEHIKTKGVVPDRNKIRDIVKGIAPETVQLAPETRVVVERAAMKAEIKKLRDRIAELEEEVESLRERSGSGGGSQRSKKRTSRKPARKSAKSKVR